MILRKMLLSVSTTMLVACAPAPEKAVARGAVEQGAVPQKIAAQHVAVQEKGAQAPTVQREAPLFVFEGDSMSVESPNTWPVQLAETDPFVGDGESINIARRGTKTLLLHRDYLRQARPIKPAPGRPAYYFLFMGSVDLARDTMPAEAIYKNLSWAWQQARDDGFKVVAFTIKPATGITGAREVERKKLNQLILGDSKRYDALVRMDLILPNPTDRNYLLPDGMHPTRAGHAVISRAVADVIGGN